MATRFNLDELRDYRQRRLIRSHDHEELPLTIWNYTQKTQVERQWDVVTNACRGLVLHSETGEVVARSFPKFHNYEEQEDFDGAYLCDITIYDKLDGSLGLLFHFQDQWIFCSRGSFVSQQARWGAVMLDEAQLNELDTDVSYVFEIIHPDNRIVVDYGDDQKLVFLASFNKNGTERDDHLFMQALGFERVQCLNAQLGTANTFIKFAELQAKFDNTNREGFVVRFPSGGRLKIKIESYKRLHRLKEKLSVDSLIASLQSGTDPGDVVGLYPDEAFVHVSHCVNDVVAMHRAFFQGLLDFYENLPKAPRKDFAFGCHQEPKGNKALLFLMLDGKTDEARKRAYEVIDWTPLREKHDPILRGGMTSA